MSDLEDLTEIGFEQSGHWEPKENGGISFQQTNDSTEGENVLYAFVIDEDVRYVGKTARTIKDRMRNIEYADSSQQTNIKLQGHIKDLLEEGKDVDVYSLVDDGLIHYGRFHLNLAAGLEDDIIGKLKPEWNNIGT